MRMRGCVLGLAVAALAAAAGGSPLTRSPGTVIESAAFVKCVLKSKSGVVESPKSKSARANPAFFAPNIGGECPIPFTSLKTSYLNEPVKERVTFKSFTSGGKTVQLDPAVVPITTTTSKLVEIPLDRRDSLLIIADAPKRLEATISLTVEGSSTKTRTMPVAVQVTRQGSTTTSTATTSSVWSELGITCGGTFRGKPLAIRAAESAAVAGVGWYVYWPTPNVPRCAWETGADRPYVQVRIYDQLGKLLAIDGVYTQQNWPGATYSTTFYVGQAKVNFSYSWTIPTAPSVQPDGTKTCTGPGICAIGFVPPGSPPLSIRPVLTWGNQVVK